MKNAKPLRLAAALLLAAALPAISQTSRANRAGAPRTYDPASVERGRATFVATCGFCHGSNATGGEKGPDLLRSVLVLDDENGKSIGQVVHNGRPEKGMPAFPLTAQQITDIANFLHSSIQAAADRGSYKILNIVVGDPKAGEAYFNGPGKCSTCHSVNGDLKGIASKYDAATLQGKFLQPDYFWTEGTPPRRVMAISVTVTLPSGESFTGTPVNLDDFNVSLREPDGTYRSFQREGNVPRVEIHNRLQGHQDLLRQYTDTDIHNLTAYLSTLK